MTEFSPSEPPVLADVPVAVLPGAEHLAGRPYALPVDVLAQAEAAGGLPEPEPQRGEPTYAAKIDPAELRIDWSGNPAAIDRLIRLGGAWTTWRGRRIKLHAADFDPATGELTPTLVQPEGKPPMPYTAWRNGAQPAPGEWFE